MSEAILYELRDTVALIQLDDGKANALSHAVIDALHAALDRAETEAAAVVLAGRPGRFSAGFDLSVMRQGGDAVGELVGAGARLALRLYEFPLPVVIACTGHALAMGGILLLSVDYRVGAAGAFKIGLNEVAIGMTLPIFGVEFGRERLSKRHLARAVAQAEIYDPAGAVDAGFLDTVVPAESLLDEALSRAGQLAQLNRMAHRNTKLRLRADAIAAMRQTLDEDMKGLTAPRA